MRTAEEFMGRELGLLGPRERSRRGKALDGPERAAPPTILDVRAFLLVTTVVLAVIAAGVGTGVALQPSNVYGPARARFTIGTSLQDRGGIWTSDSETRSTDQQVSVFVLSAPRHPAHYFHEISAVSSSGGLSVRRVGTLVYARQKGCWRWPPSKTRWLGGRAGRTCILREFVVSNGEMWTIGLSIVAAFMDRAAMLRWADRIFASFHPVSVLRH